VVFGYADTLVLAIMLQASLFRSSVGSWFAGHETGAAAADRQVVWATDSVDAGQLCITAQLPCMIPLYVQ
jgi:hypothetical protein